MSETTIKDHLNRLVNPRVRPILDQLRVEIKALGGDVREYSTLGYIGYKVLNNRQFAAIHVLKHHIDLFAHLVGPGGALLDPKYEQARIRSSIDDYSKVMGNINRAYKILSGV